ncbi:transferrin [Bactrocera oleae]|uniref:transferrin n=1 Tax=Bactrocera oleae TaxID=104688 RepID=UPI00387E3C2A
MNSNDALSEMLKIFFAAVIPLLLTVAEAYYPPGGPNRFGPPRPGGRPPVAGRPGGPPPFSFPPRPGFPGPGPRPPVPRPPPVLPPLPPLPPRPQPQPQLGNLRLCTYTQLAQDKCLYTLAAAANASIDLKLQCVQASSFAACLSAIQRSAAHLVVADDHEYRAARAAYLTTVLYAHENLTDYYVAVAPRNITLVDLDEATIQVNVSNPRALDAAAYFNLQRGHDICQQSVLDNVTIQIVNTAEYNATDDEILICANRTVAEWSDYRTCNFETSLERAVFAAKPLAASAGFRCLVQSTFNTILNSFGSENATWNFFADFQNTSDVIFKNYTIGFSQSPIIRNGITEQVFSQLHCNNVTVHDPSELE